MDALRRDQVLLRSKFEELAGLLQAELRTKEQDITEVKTVFALIESKFHRLVSVNEKILNLMKDEPTDDQVYEQEFNLAEEDRDRMDRCQVLTDAAIQASKSTQNIDGRSSTSHSGSPTSRREFHLPKLEWKKFSGDPKDWLGFWGQFQKIHEDVSIGAADKFQYLLQAVEQGSRAGDLVASFPPSATCYPKAIDSLKNRFGREDVLVEVYVRELLQLVIQNTGKQKVILSSLYDKLETFLRALESLNVTSDKYAAMLYPLVESCLPEDVMRAWERTRSQITVAGAGGAPPNQLTLLMSFLRTEVEGEERISMARKGFGMEREDKNKKTRTKVEEVCPDVPTAAGLFSGDKEQQKKRQECIFCGKTNHGSRNCFKGRNMSVEEKKKIASSKKLCFSCLKSGHTSSQCDENLKCRRCSQNHCEMMCSQPRPPRKENSSNNNEEESKDHTLANQTCTPEVLMQTLMVKLLHEDKEIIVRAVIDSGSQRSYVRADVARAIGYSSQGEERVQHSLFGGSVSKIRVHQKYQIRVSSLDKSYRCTFAALDEDVICGDLPVADKGPWMQEVQKLGIKLADCRSDPPEIQLLLGVDVCKKLETGRKFDFVSGPSAVETHLGWTLCGKAPGGKSKADSSLLVMSMFVREAEVQDLWKLDTIGITDPAESKSREELQQAAMDYFLKTVSRNEQGRYEVSLPWISGHRELQSNRFIAEKRLLTATKKIESEGVMEAYKKIFDNSEEEGVVEVVPLDEITNSGHYLPHRAVLKPQSETTPVRPVFDASAKEKFSPSLNDCLEKGPNLLELIPDVLTKFRLDKIGVVADVKMAFLQISVRPEDRDFLRFLRWEDPKKRERIKVYRLRRVVFGVSSSPFLLESAWWEGPDWLKFLEESWPKSKFAPDEEVVNSEKQKTVAAHLRIRSRKPFSDKLLKISFKYRKKIERKPDVVTRSGRKVKPRNFLSV